MEVKVSVSLQQIYKESRKNYDMALMTLLDSFDQKTFKKAIDIINPISLKGKVTTVKIGESAVNQIKDTFECEDVSAELINLLLWVAVLFPEI